MEYLCVVILIPMALVVGLSIAYWLRRTSASIARFVRGAIRDGRGQDLVEYALMAGFVAVVAGAVVPGMSKTVARIACAVLAAVVLFAIVWRRHKNPKY